MNRIKNLKSQLEDLKKSNPKLRNRDLAEKLGISEAELLTLNIGDKVVLLRDDFKSLLENMYQMGKIMALTRNSSVVHERKGIYENVTFYKGEANMGVAVNPDIDMRYFMNAWKYGLAVVMVRPKGDDLYSFQFFNEEGEAVHKIFSTVQSDITAYHSLVEQYKADEQEPIEIQKSQTKPSEKEEIDISQVDVAGFREAWINLDDTHSFFGMLKSFNLDRLTALSIAPEGMTQKVSNQSVEKICALAAERQVPIMCFVHSKGCVQIHTGPIRNLKTFGDWFNVLDPDFNLHLKSSDICETWVVRKPTKDGIVTSLELFDKEGNLITYFFGARKPGVPELEEWRSIVDDTIVSTLVNQ
ncbi:hemin-degrading factor [Membranihabitans marinus]|uniref:hemin-degrading factor n=1 Tax=Membranihabitans marinus TaxID=1227546 RepID=UPI001F3EBCC6|nr:ChuX/HutX family heme-like substrate-binding protein [Membranihabitans marinus]